MPGKTKSLSPQKINVQVQRILDHSTFKRSPTLTNFLKYIITETLSGRSHQIKEYNIAISVLSRPADYNPHEDAIVRIHAGRLRRALDEYYLTQGILDPVIIDVPKGSYVPTFSLCDSCSKSETPSGTRNKVAEQRVVAILPFITTKNQVLNEFTNSLRERLSARLAHIQDISVVGYFSQDMTEKLNANILDAGKLIGADYLISGCLQNYGREICFWINLIASSTGEVVMSATFFTKQIQHSRILEIEDEIIPKISAAIAEHSITKLKKAEFHNMVRTNETQVLSN